MSCPRIYVASLADYNAGRLHGVWIEIDDTTDADDIQEQVDAMLAASKGPIAEEWAIHDHEGFGRTIGEYDSFELVAALGAAIAEHGDAMLAWVDNYGTSNLEDCDFSEFEESYQGEYGSEQDFAQQFAEDIGAIDKDNSWPNYCIDWERAARELFMDYWSAPAEEGGVHVFRVM